MLWYQHHVSMWSDKLVSCANEQTTWNDVRREIFHDWQKSNTKQSNLHTVLCDNVNMNKIPASSYKIINFWQHNFLFLHIIFPDFSPAQLEFEPMLSMRLCKSTRLAALISYMRINNLNMQSRICRVWEQFSSTNPEHWTLRHSHFLPPCTSVYTLLMLNSHVVSDWLTPPCCSFQYQYQNQWVQKNQHTRYEKLVLKHHRSHKLQNLHGYNLTGCLHLCVYTDPGRKRVSGLVKVLSITFLKGLEVRFIFKNIARSL